MGKLDRVPNLDEEEGPQPGNVKEPGLETSTMMIPFDKDMVIDEDVKLRAKKFLMGLRGRYLNDVQQAKLHLEIACEDLERIAGDENKWKITDDDLRHEVYGDLSDDKLRQLRNLYAEAHNNWETVLRSPLTFFHR